MPLLRTGSTRWVFLVGPYAIKIPRLDYYRNFLLGILANQQEAQWARLPFARKKLCPVLFRSWLYLVIVMPRARTLKEGELSRTDLELFCTVDEDWTLPAELKADSFGYLPDGRLVAVDYGS
jgi:hypothetical protein